MKQTNTITNHNQVLKSTPVNTEIPSISNPLLKRLMEEVKNDQLNNITSYNRTHNRHNRGR
jgi:hypothetical protein